MKYIKKHPSLINKNSVKLEEAYMSPEEVSKGKQDTIGSTTVIHPKNDETQTIGPSASTSLNNPEEDKNNTEKSLETKEKDQPQSVIGLTASTKKDEPQGGSSSNTNQQIIGSASVIAPTQGASASIPLTIDGLFGTIFQKEERQKWELSDEDYKKMEYIGTQPVESWSYTPDDTDKDPIIKIVDLFQQAHQLYFTPQIPSGRPLGKVSQKTYLEYTYVGHDQKNGGGQWREESGPNGPFIVNSIFNKWRDGIEKIFQDKEMRKIFANSKFRVKNTTVVEEPNKQTKLESIQFINEAEEPIGNDKQGQIIFTFMRNMLDKNKLADFDSNKNKLMFDYFGIKGDSVDKVTYNGNKLHINSRDIEPNTFFWRDTPFTYDKLDKKFFIMPASKESVYICIGLQKADFNLGGKEEFRGNYFYYWLNDDKIVRDWISKKYPKFKLMSAAYQKSEGIQGIGLLDIKKQDPKRTVTLNNTDYEWYLIESKGPNTFDNLNVKTNANKGYPTINGKVAQKINFGNTRLEGYSQLTSGKDLTFYECDDDMYNNYMRLLNQTVKDKLIAAVKSNKSNKSTNP